MNKLSLLSHCIAKFDLFIRKFIFDLKIIFTAEKEKNYILFFEKFRLIKIQIIMILLKIFLFKIKIISLY